jgi:hypothetical protein
MDLLGHPVTSLNTARRLFIKAVGIQTAALAFGGQTFLQDYILEQQNLIMVLLGLSVKV